MDYDFITTCNWTSTGTYTMRAYLGSNLNVVTSYSLFYRKKGDLTWIETTNGQVVISSTGEWEIGNDWNKVGDNVLTHSYLSITDIDSCTDVYFNETTLGTTIGDYFLYVAWASCTNLSSMPTGFNLPTGITTVGDYFLLSTWNGCSNLSSMPSGFNLPTGLTTFGAFFLANTWDSCTNLTSMPTGFNLPTGITTAGFLFLNSTWNNCTLLSDDDYTEPITIEFTTGYRTFGGTTPITTTDPIVGTKETPVLIQVNRQATRTRHFTYNTGALISGTGQIGNIAYQTLVSFDYSASNKWRLGPYEDYAYIICRPWPSGDHPTADNLDNSYVAFWKSEKTDTAFFELVSKLSKTTITTSVDATNWINSQGYFTSYNNAWIV